MSKARKIELRVSKNEYERIRNNTQAKGYPTMSAYLRSIALESDLLIDKKIMETNSIVKEILNKLSQN